MDADDSDKPVSLNHLEAINNELDEVVAMVSGIEKTVKSLTNAVDELMRVVADKESVAMKFSNYPPGGYNHEN